MKKNNEGMIIAGLAGLAGGIIIADKYRKSNGISIVDKITKTGEELMKEMVKDKKIESIPNDTEKKEESEKEVIKEDN